MKVYPGSPIAAIGEAVEFLQFASGERLTCRCGTMFRKGAQCKDGRLFFFWCPACDEVHEDAKRK